jgi:membrane associated rhomboid family serine protease
MFDSAEVWRGQIWRLFTYAFIHYPSPSALLWFAIEMYMLFFFGREVERFMGQRAYIWLYGLLLLAPALVLSLWGLSTRTGLAGSAPLHFAVFTAFVTLYPNVQFFLRIPAKWIFVILAAIGTLSALAAHDWANLVVLWASVAISRPGYNRSRNLRSFPNRLRRDATMTTSPNRSIPFSTKSPGLVLAVLLPMSGESSIVRAIVC